MEEVEGYKELEEKFKEDILKLRSDIRKTSNSHWESILGIELRVNERFQEESLGIVWDKLEKAMEQSINKNENYFTRNRTSCINKTAPIKLNSVPSIINIPSLATKYIIK